GIDARSIVRVAPDGRIAVARQGDDVLLFRPGSSSVPRRIASPGHPMIALSRTFLAIADGSRVRVFRSADGSPVADEALDLGDVNDLALLDAPPRLAVAGAEPEVRLLTLEGRMPVQTIAVARGANSLAWNADGPSLIVAGDAGLSVWRDGSFLPEHYPDAAQQKDLLYVDGGGALLLDGITHRLALFDIGNLPIERSYALGTSESWAVHVDSAHETVHVGSSNGTVYSLHGEQVIPHPLHADGVTALAGDAAHLASASDDRTVAIWNLPDMTVEWRSRSHDYLVNQIALVGPHLWSSSSDGTLKSWHWPTLEEEQTIDLRALTGSKALRLHAFWIDPSQNRALVGTWNSRLIALDLRGNQWVAKSLPIASSGGYHLIGVPDVNVVVVQGTQPSRLYVYDLDKQRLFDLPDLGNTYYTLTTDGSPDGVLLGGLGVIARYRLERIADVGLEVTIEAHTQSGLGTLTAADFDPAHNRLWAADANGHLLAIDTAGMSRQSAFRALLRPTDAP
ncbi:MAG: hypothetical protein ABIR62_17110, partial [Dokdonella sp.]|uniref:WD40 repeat domain-containing protein n=1 Tax=Dokdonella sp. TaxID=2291710 RepID=UPI003265E86F